MKIISPSWKMEDSRFNENPLDLLKAIERYGRTCYKSEDKITEESCLKFVRMLIEKGHESVLEHEKLTVRIICDRGVSHEIVRHRIASYSQESTRYCNYGNTEDGVTFILPLWYVECHNVFCEEARLSKQYKEEYTKHNRSSCERYSIWIQAMKHAELSYLDLIDNGATPEEARAVLPNSLKTELVVTYNMREWRHFFRLRASPKAHPQMREITIPMLNIFKQLFPVLFDDIII